MTTTCDECVYYAPETRFCARMQKYVSHVAYAECPPDARPHTLHEYRADKRYKWEYTGVVQRALDGYTFGGLGEPRVPNRDIPGPRKGNSRPHFKCGKVWRRTEKRRHTHGRKNPKKQSPLD